MRPRYIFQRLPLLFNIYCQKLQSGKRMTRNRAFEVVFAFMELETFVLIFLPSQGLYIGNTGEETIIR